MILRYIIRALTKPFSTRAIVERELKAAEKAIEVFEAAEVILDRLADLYHDVDRFADAERCLRKLVGISPRNPRALSRLAYICARRHHWDDAVAISSCALRFDGNCYLAHWVKGKALVEKGAYAEAVAALGQAIWIEDTEACTHELLARAHEALGHTAEADFHKSRALVIREAADK
jgi:Flp pilus assembly protein TadD